MRPSCADFSPGSVPSATAKVAKSVHRDQPTGFSSKAVPGPPKYPKLWLMCTNCSGIRSSVLGALEVQVVKSDYAISCRKTSRFDKATVESPLVKLKAHQAMLDVLNASGDT